MEGEWWGEWRESGGERVRKVEGGRRREGSKIGPEARQKALRLRATSRRQTTAHRTLGWFSLFLSFCLFFCLYVCPTTTTSTTPFCFWQGEKVLFRGFGELTLCGCVTEMAMGYRAQGQDGSREMYFYLWFQGTILVQRLMSHKHFFISEKEGVLESVSPPSNKSPSAGQETLSFPSTISTENVIVSQISSNFFDT